MISRLHYTSLFNAEAHSSRRLQLITAVEHTSHIGEVYAPFVASIQSHNGHKSTIGLFGYQALHLAFSEAAEIPSEMEREQFAKRVYRVAWSELSIQLRGATRGQRCACTRLRLGEVQDAVRW